jgi:type VII secretion-associated serine protease mycosin
VVTVAAVLLAAPAAAHADSIRDQEWQLRAMHASSAWKYASGQGVIVAVLDSGVDATHPDLYGRVLPGADFVDTGGDGRKDEVGHGTAVATLIAGRDDDSGIVGLAHHAKILPVRVLDRENRYKDAVVVAKGLRWAVDHGADVVNLSLGGNLESVDLAEAIQYAYDHDVVIVACSGNAGSSDKRIWYPAREPGVIAVTGLERDGTFWKRSLAGPASVLSAPAAEMVAAKPGGYWRVEGTSFAAPLVSATAALVRSNWPDMTAANVVNRLIRTARDLGPAGRDDKYGYGEVDPVGALTTPVTSVSRNPLDTTARRPTPSRAWSKSPAMTQAASAPHPTAPWWLLGLGMAGGGGLAAVITTIVVVRRRRTQ